jgi:hypothetical protein
MFKISLFILLFPVLSYAQPTWFKDSKPNNFATDMDYFFQVSSSDKLSKDQAIALAAMDYRKELDKLILDFGSFVLTQFNNETDIEVNGYSDLFRKEVIGSSLEKLSMSLPTPAKIETDQLGTEHRAFIQFKVSRSELATIYSSFLANQDKGLYIKFRHTDIYNSHFSN